MFSFRKLNRLEIPAFCGVNPRRQQAEAEIRMRALTKKMGIPRVCLLQNASDVGNVRDLSGPKAGMTALCGR
jgi:hypothetical protein